MSASTPREKERKRIYEQAGRRPSLTCSDCGVPVSKAAIRCVPCHDKYARGRSRGRSDEGQPRLRAYGNRTPTSGELRRIKRTPPVPTILQGLEMIEKWQRGEA
jgi:hypothetical protein